MKEQINLLPPLAKHERLGRLYRQRLAYLGRRALIGFMIVWVVMAGIFWWVRQRQRELEALARTQTRDGGEVFREVARVNELMSVINQRVGQHPDVTPLLDDIVRTLPPGARLTVLALQANTGGLVVRGTSPSRGGVLDMQRQLEALPGVERVEAPLQNFAVDSSGEFSFTLFRKVEK